MALSNLLEPVVQWLAGHRMRVERHREYLRRVMKVHLQTEGPPMRQLPNDGAAPPCCLPQRLTQVRQEVIWFCHLRLS